jgi:hypothetical protein
VTRIVITAEAYEAIAATLPLGSVAFEPQLGASRERWIWLPEHVVKRNALWPTRRHRS